MKVLLLATLVIGAQAQVAISVNLAARSEPAAWKAWASSPGTGASVTAGAAADAVSIVVQGAVPAAPFNAAVFSAAGAMEVIRVTAVTPIGAVAGLGGQLQPLANTLTITRARPGTSAVVIPVNGRLVIPAATNAGAHLRNVARTAVAAVIRANSDLSVAKAAIAASEAQAEADVQ